MHQKQLTCNTSLSVCRSSEHSSEKIVFLEDLLPSLNATNLIDNQAFIKRIWDRSKQLDVVENDDEGRKLTQYGTMAGQIKVRFYLL